MSANIRIISTLIWRYRRLLHFRTEYVVVCVLYRWLYSTGFQGCVWGLYSTGVQGVWDAVMHESSRGVGGCCWRVLSPSFSPFLRVPISMFCLHVYLALCSSGSRSSSCCSSRCGRTQTKVMLFSGGRLWGLARLGRVIETCLIKHTKQQHCFIHMYW